jgi:hypothetical protein
MSDPMKHPWERPSSNTVHIGRTRQADPGKAKDLQVDEVCCRYRPNADPLSLLRIDMGGENGRATLKYLDVRVVRMPSKKRIEVETSTHLLIIEGNQLGTLYNVLGESRVLSLTVVSATTATDVPSGQATIDSIKLIGGHDKAIKENRG